jgi:tetratricopeptide (TPR) repeat protein
MRKTPSTDLFTLIRSLDKGEKRNFRLMAKVVARGGTKRYLELYEVLEGWDELDEEALARRFGDQLANLKHYLYGLILRSLSHFDTSPSANFAATREQARILMEKGLFPQAEKLLHRAIEDARLHEWWEALGQLLSLMITLITNAMVEQPGTRLQARIEALRAEEAQAFQHHRHIRDLKELSQVVMHKVRQPQFAMGTQARKALAREIMALPRMAAKDEADPVLAQYTYWKIVALLDNDVHSEVWNHAIAHIEALVEAHATIFEPIVLEWMPYVHVRAATAAQQRDFAVAEDHYARFLALEMRSGKYRTLFQARSAWMRVHMEVCRGDAHRLAQVLRDEQADALALISKTPGRTGMVLGSMFALGHWMSGAPRQALDWLQRPRMMPAGGMLPATAFVLRKWSIMANFDIENYTIVETELKSLKRACVKHGRVSPSDRFFLRAMRKLSKVVQEESHLGTQVDRILDSYEKLLRTDPHADWLERSIHFWAWLRAKQDGRPPCAYTWYLHRQMVLVPFN